MDEGKIVIINLSKGRIGEQNANLLGSLLITKIYLSAMSRADIHESELKKLPNFYLYVDEFQSFSNESFADILSEARKYKLNLTIAHQYIEQMSDEVRAAVFGNVGTMITFRVGSYDAEVLEKEFEPVFTAQDIVNLGMFQIYLRLMIDGIGSRPFSAVTLPPLDKPQNSSMEEVIKNSREQYSKPRVEVEEVVRKIVEEGRDNDNTSPKKKETKEFKKPKKKENGFNNTNNGNDLKTQLLKVTKNKDIKDPFDSKDETPIEKESLDGINKKKFSNKGASEVTKNQLKEALAGVLGNKKDDGVTPDDLKRVLNVKRDS